MPDSQVAKVLGRISSKKTVSYKSLPMEIAGHILVVGLCPVSAITQEPNENPIAYWKGLKSPFKSLPIWT